MLRTNLSTRPFYNQRAVAVAIATVALAALALSVYNGARILSLTARSADLSGRVGAAEARAQELSAQSGRVRDSLNRTDVSATATAAREANLLIDRRAFSWTALFNRFEETLPGDVRITAVRPQIDRQGQFMLAINVISRSVESVDAFIGELEKSGAFRTALPVNEQLQDDNTFRSVIQAYYLPSASKPTATSEPDSATDVAPANGAATEVAPGSAGAPANGAAPGNAGAPEKKVRAR